MQNVAPDSETLEGDYDSGRHLHILRLGMLDRMISYMQELKDVGGMRAIPFMQLVLSLIVELDGNGDRDKATLDALLSSLITWLLQLGAGRDVNTADVGVHTPRQLVVLHLLSVLMSRTRTSNKAANEMLSFVNIQTGRALIVSDGVEYCLQLLKIILGCWQSTVAAIESEGSVISCQLLKPRLAGSPPDMSPFFLRQYEESCKQCL